MIKINNIESVRINKKVSVRNSSNNLYTLAPNDTARFKRSSTRFNSSSNKRKEFLEAGRYLIKLLNLFRKNSNASIAKESVMNNSNKKCKLANL